MIFRKLLMAGAVVAALAGAGATQAQPPPPPAAGGAMPTPEFVRMAAATDKYERDAARVALMKSSNPHVRAFAQRMLRDHTKSTEMIKMALADSGHPPPPPPMLMPDQQQMLATLRGTPRPAFDRAYIDQQVMVHQMALGVMQGYASGGTDPALRRAAGRISGVVQMHLQMAQDIQSHLG